MIFEYVLIHFFGGDLMRFCKIVISVIDKIICVL